MKKILLTSLLMVPTFMFAQTIILTDNFDSYTAGNKVVAQSAGLWDTWSGGAGGVEDAMVSNAFASSGTNSMNVFNTGPGVYEHDMVLPFPSTYVSGRYEFKMKIYIAKGSGGYFNLGGTWVSGGTGYQYGTQVFFNGDASGFVNTSGTLPFSYNQDSWTDVKVVVDLDASPRTCELFINSASMGSTPWGAASGLGVADIFGYARATGSGTTEIKSDFYVDDVSLANTTGVGLNENDQNLSVQISPNPNSGNFTINVNDAQVSDYRITIANLSGSIVHDQEINSNGSIELDLNIPSGMYFVNLTNGVKTSTQKMIVR